MSMNRPLLAMNRMPLPRHRTSKQGTGLMMSKMHLTKMPTQPSGHVGGICWGYYTGTLVLSQITAGHCSDVIISTMASQITSLTIVYSIVHSGADQTNHQISASLAFVWGVHRWPVNSPHKEQVIRKMFPFDDVIMSMEGGYFTYDTRSSNEFKWLDSNYGVPG